MGPVYKLILFLQNLLHSGETGVLTEDKFSKLDMLLNQTDLYSKFLAEQLDAVQQSTEGERFPIMACRALHVPRPRAVMFNA